MKVAIAFPAGTRPRTTAMAQRVPSVNEMHVARKAICAESSTEETRESALAIALYQRSEKPSGGKAKIADGENDTATTIRIGANRKARTSASTIQQKAMPTRAISTPRVTW